jgi:hypothetical protein
MDGMDRGKMVLCLPGVAVVAVAVRDHNNVVIIATPRA